MTNYERLRIQQDESLDETAVRLLISQIKNDVDKRVFKTFSTNNVYENSYKNLKDWLNNEAEE